MHVNGKHRLGDSLQNGCIKSLRFCTTSGRPASCVIYSPRNINCHHRTHQTHHYPLVLMYVLLHCLAAAVISPKSYSNCGISDESTGIIRAHAFSTVNMYAAFVYDLTCDASISPSKMGWSHAYIEPGRSLNITEVSQIHRRSAPYNVLVTRCVTCVRGRSR